MNFCRRAGLLITERQTDANTILSISVHPVPD